VRCHHEQICRHSGGQPLTSWCTYHGNIRYTSGGADCPPDTSHQSSVGDVCNMPQYSKQELFFRQLTGFYAHSQQPSIRSYCTFYAHQTIINCLLWLYSPTVHYLLQCWFSDQKKNWLCCNCVINYEVRSGTFWDFIQCRMAICTATVLLEPWRWDR